MESYIKQTKCFRFDGVSVLRTYYRIPEIMKNMKIFEFYKLLTENISIWVENELFPTICNDYRADVNPKKRFGYGYIYSFESIVVFCDDDITSVLTTATLKKNGMSQSESCHKTAQIWRNSDGLLLPLEAVSTSRERKTYRRERSVGYYVGVSGLTAIKADNNEFLICETNYE